MRDFLVSASGYLRDDDPQVLAWEREIDKVLLVRTAEAHLCFAELWQLVGDVERADLHLDRAVENRGHVVTANQTRLVVYCNLLYASKALRIAPLAVDVRYQNIGEGLASVVGCGALAHARELIAQAALAKLDLQQTNQFQSITNVLERMQMHRELPDSAIASAIDAAGDVMRKRRLFWLERSPRFSFDEGTGCMGIRYKVGVSPVEAAKMTLEVADLLIERELLNVPITVGFVGVAR